MRNEELPFAWALFRCSVTSPSARVTKFRVRNFHLPSSFTKVSSFRSTQTIRGKNWPVTPWTTTV